MLPLQLLRPLRLRLHRSQPFLKISAYHLVHVHEHAERLADETVPAGHCPIDVGIAAFGLEGELHIIVCFERSNELEPHVNELILLAFEKW